MKIPKSITFDAPTLKTMEQLAQERDVSLSHLVREACKTRYRNEKKDSRDE